MDGLEGRCDMIAENRFAPKLDYTIPAKPTVYRGWTYDSKEEAQYAVMFDHLPWDWIYHHFKIASGKYNAIEPDFVVSKYPTGRRRKWEKLRWEDSIVEIKPTFVTPQAIRSAIENDTATYQLTALSQLAAEGHQVIVCTGALFDRDRKMECVQDLVSAGKQDFVDILRFSTAQLIQAVQTEILLKAVIAARRFKFHLQTREILQRAYPE